MGRRAERVPGAREKVTPMLWSLLTDNWRPGEPPPSAGFDAAEYFLSGPSGLSLGRAWELVGAEIVALWTEQHPGSRPANWWRFSAPEPARRRIGGVGDRLSEVLAHTPMLEYGVPSEGFVDADLLALYKRQFGKMLRNRVTGRPAVSVDPLDPPTYESEAVFLDRHNLLSAVERDALDADAFEPEAVGRLDDDADDDVPEPWRG